MKEKGDKEAYRGEEMDVNHATWGRELQDE